MMTPIVFWALIILAVVVIFVYESGNEELKNKCEEEFDRYFFGENLHDAHIQAFHAYKNAELMDICSTQNLQHTGTELSVAH